MTNEHEQRWIPVGEKLPESGEDVIVYEPDRSDPVHCVRFHVGGQAMGGVCYFDDIRGKIVTFLNEHTITHWMPMPAPPETTGTP